MQDFPTIGSSASDGIQGDEFPETGSQGPQQGCCADSEQSDAILFDDEQNDQLLKSFDMIFRLQQRSEEIRCHLERIDHILLTSRSVNSLAESIIATLETELDLVAVRFLFKEDHPVASIFRRHESYGTGIISEDFLDNEGLFRGEPFVLDDPAGGLAHRLFGDAAALIASAAVAPLCHEDEELGLLCLGSDDPCRYCGGMNTELIASMSAKISLGFLNAWDHQNSARRAFTTGIDGVYTESFFNEYLEKEFNRSWRNGATFSLVALSWKSAYPDASPCPDPEVLDLLQGRLRSSDLAAQGEAVKLWVLLSDTDWAGAEIVGKRLIDMSMEHFNGDISLHIGIVEFSRSAPVCSTLLQYARSALDEALSYESDQIVIKTAPTRASAAAESAEPDAEHTAAHAL
jgi:uncharacterized protein YigA (DUF484 family)